MATCYRPGWGKTPRAGAMLDAGIAQETPATSINMVCGSGLQSVIFAAETLAAGSAEVVLAGNGKHVGRALFAGQRALGLPHG